MSENLVVDCSAIVGLFFEDERSNYHDQLLDRMARAIVVVPGIWMSEIAIVLLVGERRKCVNGNQIETYLQDLLRLNPEIINVTDDDNILIVTALARDYGLTIYDAQYLYVAQSGNLPLATQDKKLRSAASKAKVTVI